VITTEPKTDGLETILDFIDHQMETKAYFTSTEAFFKLTFAMPSWGGEARSPRLDEAIWLNIKIYFSVSAPFREHELWQWSSKVEFSN
jgi:hypothetical protein